jgi:hypothetical protein
LAKFCLTLKLPAIRCSEIFFDILTNLILKEL